MAVVFVLASLPSCILVRLISIETKQQIEPMSCTQVQQQIEPISCQVNLYIQPSYQTT